MGGRYEPGGLRCKEQFGAELGSVARLEMGVLYPVLGVGLAAQS